ncbi:MAG TPA: hypothetical protein VN750_14235 [Steroidobacteraceae bacterium]|nr:hypothetical protein [Steroidobacteraceae bacterium]
MSDDFTAYIVERLRKEAERAARRRQQPPAEKKKGRPVKSGLYHA